jgi:hypothetical protein
MTQPALFQTAVESVLHSKYRWSPFRPFLCPPQQPLAGNKAF